MVERDQVQQGILLRLLKPMGRVASGTLGRVEMIRQEQWGNLWGFSVHWQGNATKNRHSLYFSEADLEGFELVPGNTVQISPSPYPSEQLTLPYRQWFLHQGTQVLDSFETWP